jgi:hypothetical protein
VRWVAGTLFLVIAGTLEVRGTGTIRGPGTDAASGQQIPSATVSITRRAQAVVT